MTTTRHGNGMEIDGSDAADAAAGGATAASGAGEPGLDAIAPGVEAVLLSSTRPVASSRIAEVLAAVVTPGVDAAMVEAAIESLNAGYDESGRAFRIEPVSGGFRVMTRPEHAAVLAAFHRSQASSKLSRAAVESLAIIAYKQPITRAKLEAIRGVGCGEVLRSLLERKLIAVTGRAEELGRPMLYGTTRQFLDVFGIRSIRDLPEVESLVPPETGQGGKGRAGSQGRARSSGGRAASKDARAGDAESAAGAGASAAAGAGDENPA